MLLLLLLWLDLWDSWGQREGWLLLLLLLGVVVVRWRSGRWLVTTTHDVCARQGLRCPWPMVETTATTEGLLLLLMDSRLLGCCGFRWPRWRQRIAAIIAIHERLCAPAFALL